MSQQMKEAVVNGNKTRTAPVAVPHEAVLEQLERVVADPLFRYSHRSVNLLKYIIDRSLKGKNEDLKERIIGIEVFGRTPDYDTSNDSTVRVVANEVRKRLTEYYSKPEHATELRIDIPVRSYIAEFHQAAGQTPEPVPVAPAPPNRFKLTLRPRIALTVLAAVALLALVWGGIRLLTPVPVIARFWAPLIESSNPVLICIGSPYETPNAADGAPAAPPAVTPRDTPFYDFEQRVYVRMMDASAADSLARFLKRSGKDSVVRPTQGTQLTEMQGDPLILYGMALNEWAVKLGSDLRFVLRKDSESGHGVRWIEDTRQLASHAWRVDLAAPYQNVSTDYALISRVRDRTTGRWWIGIAGLTGVAALAASQVLMEPNAMATVGASLPRGWENKNLQIVLETKVVQGRPGATQVVTAFSW